MEPLSPCTPDSTSRLDDLEERLRQDDIASWMRCFVVVTFDLDIGQTIEYQYPPGQLTQKEEAAVCFLSFPDSNSFNTRGDVTYTFRLRHDSNLPLNAASPLEQTYSYGFVFFRQEKDSTISRGYFQKSVVLLTSLPFVGLFKQVSQVVGPMFFDYGSSVLEAVCHNIAGWPKPYPGLALELPLVGLVLGVRIPSALPVFRPGYAASAPSKPTSSAAPQAHRPLKSPLLLGAVLDKVNAEIPGFFQETSVWRSCKYSLSQLWFLWETILTGQPLLVVAPTPTICSEAVLALVSLISPLQYGGDFRPYFTIYDPDFKEYQAQHDKNELPAVVLGVTNPFFLKTMGNWPIVWRVAVEPAQAESSGLNIFGETFFSKAKSVIDLSPSKSPVAATCKPLVSSDKTVIKQLLADCESSGASAINNTLLRKHFRALTDQFLSAFDRYFVYDLSNMRHAPYGELPPLPFYDETQFLLNLERTGPPPRFTVCKKMRWLTLYSRFVKSPNFRPWFNHQRQMAVMQQQYSVRDIRVTADLNALIAPLNCEQLIELAQKILAQIEWEKNRPDKAPDRDEAFMKLEKQLHLVNSRIPIHMRPSNQPRHMRSATPPGNAPKRAAPPSFPLNTPLSSLSATPSSLSSSPAGSPQAKSALSVSVPPFHIASTNLSLEAPRHPLLLSGTISVTQVNIAPVQEPRASSSNVDSPRVGSPKDLSYEFVFS